MSVRYINDLVCVVDRDTPLGKPLSDIDASVEKILGIRTAKDLLLFLDQAGAETFTIFGPLSMTGNDAVFSFVSEEPGNIYGQDLSGLVEKYLPDAEYLDRWSLEDLGKISEDKSKLQDGELFSLEVIDLDSPYDYFPTDSATYIIREIKALAKYAAIANGHDGGIEKLPIKDCLAIDGNLRWYSELHLPTDSFRGDFDRSERERIIEELHAFDDGIKVAHCENDEMLTSISRDRQSKVFLYPKGTTERTIALDIFAAFMNSFYTGGQQVYFMDNTFGVDIAEGKIHVYAKESPYQRFYHEIANLAAADRFAVCPHCGNAFYRPTNRLNYCSDSCKTLASKGRREKTMAFAYSGKPIEQAIEAIGEEYTSSVKKWYKEAQAITASLAE